MADSRKPREITQLSALNTPGLVLLNQCHLSLSSATAHLPKRAILELCFFLTASLLAQAQGEDVIDKQDRIGNKYWQGCLLNEEKKNIVSKTSSWGK